MKNFPICKYMLVWNHLFSKQIVRFEELYFLLSVFLNVYVEDIYLITFLLRVIRYLCLLGGQKSFHRNRITVDPR